MLHLTYSSVICDGCLTPPFWDSDGVCGVEELVSKQQAKTASRRQVEEGEIKDGRDPFRGF